MFARIRSSYPRRGIFLFSLLFLFLSLPLSAEDLPSLDGLAQDKPEILESHRIYYRINEVWNRAWGEPFTPSDSAMLLKPTGAAGTWDVFMGLRTEGMRAEGFFIENLRFDVGIEKDEDREATLKHLGLERYERYVVAGILTGSTGESFPLYGLILDLGDRLMDEDHGPLLAFAPIEATREVEAARLRAEEYAQAMRLGADRADLASSLPGGDPKSGTCGFCELNYDSQIRLCDIERKACLAVALAGAAACVLACPISGPAAPFCIAACIAAQTAANVLCNTNHAQCYNSARAERIGCLQSCECPGCL